MASTRNINYPGNYCAEQWSYNKQSAYSTYKDYAFANQTLLPGDGLLGARIPETELAGNPKDIESFLFGIGSTNLVTVQAPVHPELRPLETMKCLSIMNKVPLIMPKDLVVQNDQRQYPMK